MSADYGAKTGTGFVSNEQAEVSRKERLRRLALESIDLAKDPYFMRNHVGQYECRLCLTAHKNEGNYLAHTQGKRHQQNLAKRALQEAAEREAAPAPQRRVAGSRECRPTHPMRRSYPRPCRARWRPSALRPEIGWSREESSPSSAP